MRMRKIRDMIGVSAAVAAAMAMLASSTPSPTRAADAPDDATIVAVEPARILDTRDPTDIGLAGPFVSQVSQKLQVSGLIPTTTGFRTVVPNGSAGVLLNVTVVAPSAAGFVSIRPGTASGAPATSSLNFEAGAIVPNSVQVAFPLSGPNQGQIDITYDAYGLSGPVTDILIDVVGYLVRGVPTAWSDSVNDIVPDPEGIPKILASVDVLAPSSGLVQMVGSTWILTSTGGEASCWLTIGTDNITNSGALENTNRSVTVPSGSAGTCITNGALQVAAGTHRLNLVGVAPSGLDLDDTTLDAIFVPGGRLTST